MTIATCADLKAAAATYMARSDLTSRIPEWIANTETRIAYGSREPNFICEPLRVRAMETSADVTINAQTAALPTRYLQSRRFYLNSSPIQELGYVVPDVFWRTYISSDTARPTRFTVEGENFVFGPIPDATYTGKILYYQKFAGLSADGDTNWLLTNAPGVYLSGVLAEGFAYARKFDLAAARQTAFVGGINALNLADKADRYSGSPWQAFTDSGNP